MATFGSEIIHDREVDTTTVGESNATHHDALDFARLHSPGRDTSTHFTIYGYLGWWTAAEAPMLRLPSVLADLEIRVRPVVLFAEFQFDNSCWLADRSAWPDTGYIKVSDAVEGNGRTIHLSTFATCNLESFGSVVA